MSIVNLCEVKAAASLLGGICDIVMKDDYYTVKLLIWEWLTVFR